MSVCVGVCGPWVLVSMYLLELELHAIVVGLELGSSRRTVNALTSEPFHQP